jgi:hypothetical protein
MRTTLVGALLGASLVIGVLAGRGFTAPGENSPIDMSAHATGSELFTTVTPTEGALTVTVIDPRQRALAVYHVDRTNGEISLKSVRNITWDLQMMENNTGKPLPQDIRNALKH